MCLCLCLCLPGPGRVTYTLPLGKSMDEVDQGGLVYGTGLGTGSTEYAPRCTHIAYRIET